VADDRRLFSGIGDNVPGEIECPMSWEYLNTRFSESASLEEMKPSAGGLTRAYEMVRNLESIDDATEMLGVLE